MCKITNPSDKISGSEMNFRLTGMKKSVLKCLLCLLLALALAGCGIAQRIEKGRFKAGYWSKPSHFTSTRFSVMMGVYFFPIFTIPALIDLPFSLAADIVCLPVEIVMDSHRNHNKEQAKQFWETYFASGASLSTNDEWREHLDGGRPTIEKHIRKPLPKHQIEDLIRIGFVNEIAEHQVIDRELFELCLGDISNGIPTNSAAIEIAKNKSTPPELLEMMIRDRAALHVVIENPNITPQMLHKIIAIAKSDPNKDKHLLENSRAALARNRQTTPDDLESLYPSESKFITDALSENPNTPDSVLCRIFADSKSNYTKRYVSRNMASRASVTPEIQNFIFMDDDYDNYTAKARLIQNKAAIPELRSALIDPKLIFEFCWYKLLSPAAVRQLFADASPEIQAILRNDYRAVISYMNKTEKE